MRKKLLLASLAALMAAPQLAAPQTLEQGFKAPPAGARPRVWWHWLNGNVTEAGIKLDLEWMHRVGIAGLQKVDVDLATPKVVPDRLVYMSPAWQAAFRDALAISSKLGLEFGVTGTEGWSESGGPFVKPADAMKKVVWSRAEVDGGAPVDLQLPPTPSVAGPFQDVGLGGSIFGGGPVLPHYAEDVAVIAYRLPTDATADAGASTVTASGGTIDAGRLFAGGDAQMLPVADQGEAWVQVAYDHPRVVRSVTVQVPASGGFGAPPSPDAILEASDDGSAYRKIADLPPSGSPERTASFPAVEARYFRVVLRAHNAGPPMTMAPGVAPLPFGGGAPKQYAISLLRLDTAAQVNRFEEKAGFATALDYYALATPPAPPSSTVPTADVIDLTSKMSADGRLRWTPPPGRWAVLRFGASLTGHENGPAPPESTGLEVDKLDRAKVKAYLDTYMGQYKAAAGPGAFGHDVRTFLNDSTEAGPQNWTDHMLEEFQRRRGYDPRPWLPALTGIIVRDAAASDRFLWDYRRTIAELVAQSHYAEMAEYAHGLHLTVYGEALEDHRPQLGDDMEMRQYTDVPMGAMWVAPGGGPANPTYVADDRGAASIAHIYGQNIVGAESLTAAGQPWAFTPRDLKRTIDLEFALGINRVIIHTSPHQPLLDKKPGLGLATFLGQYFTRNETWAEEAGPWVSYIGRNDFMLQQGRFVGDVAYFYGEEAPLTAQFGDRVTTDAPKGDGWDFVNSDVILHRLSVQGGALVTASGMRYRALYLGADARYMTLPVLKKLRDFVAAGAVIVGPRPLSSPSLSDDDGAFQALAHQLWPAGAGGAGGVAVGKGRVFARPDVNAALSALGVEPDFEFRSASGDSGLMALHRRAGATDIYYVTNQNDEPRDVEAIFRVHGKAAELWSAYDGSISDASWRAVGDRTAVPLKLDAHQSLFVVFRRASRATSHAVPTPVEHVVATVEGPWTLSFTPGWGAPAGTLKASLGSWTDSPEAGIRYFSGTGRYETKLVVPAGDIGPGKRLVLDLGDVRDLAEVTVNGRKLGVFWNPPYRVDVTSAVRAGENTIEIAVTNPWVNRLIGDAQPGATKYTFAGGPTYSAGAPLRPSGLLGPVKLIGERSH